MPTCAVVGCHSRKGEHGIRCFKFPTIRENVDSDKKALCRKRRELWKISINRPLTDEQWSKTVVCGKHFIGGLCCFHLICYFCSGGDTLCLYSIKWALLIIGPRGPA